MGLLALRLAGLPRGASPSQLPDSTPGRLHVEWAIYMVSSLHLTRTARLGLAHRMKRKPVSAGKYRVLMWSCLMYSILQVHHTS
jgi:hypothetical protein